MQKCIIDKIDLDEWSIKTTGKKLFLLSTYLDEAMSNSTVTENVVLPKIRKLSMYLLYFNYTIDVWQQK